MPIATLAILVGLGSGCAGRAPFGSSGPDPMIGASTTQQTPSLDSNLQEKKNLGSTVSAAFHSAGTKVSHALKIQPKVIPAYDPIHLSDKPEKLNAKFFLSTARIHETKGDIAGAAAQYEKALQIEPGNLAALIGYARLNDRSGNFDRAIELYEKATSSNGQSAVAFNDLGLCHARKGNLAESLAALKQAVKIEPNKKLYRNNLATVLVEADQIDEAFGHLSAAHGEAAAHYNLGYLLHKRNDKPRAIEQFTLAVEKNPSLTGAKVMLARLQEPVAPPADQEYRVHDQVADVPDTQAIAEVDTTVAPPAESETAVEPTPIETEITAVEAPSNDFPLLPADASASDRSSDFPTSLPQVESTESSPVEYPTIRLPEVGMDVYQDTNAPLPPTPDQFAVVILDDNLSTGAPSE